ncbi:MAG: AcrB/AcrD/AcrF family protein [Arcobacter sp.]|nr:MAG: AcrB/AcrD/AcrF family protein [Arcobacter sp.]
MSNETNIAGRLAKTFIDHPLTFILGLFILCLGFISLEFMPREENPQIKVSGGAVIVALPGARPSEIKKVIIEPLERKIREIKGVEHIYSFAKDSVAIVQVQYYIGEDKEVSNLKLYDQVMRNMDLLPKGAMQPIIKTMDIDTDIPIATIAFYANENKTSQTKLYNEISKIAYEVNKIKNVALVDLKGEKKEQYNVEVNSSKLSAYNLSLGQIAKQIKALSLTTPNINSDNHTNDLTILSIKNAIESKEDLENIIISYNFNTPIYLKDIAKISRSYDIQNKREAYVYKKDTKEKALEQSTLTISKLKGSNSVTINEEIFKYIDSIKPQLENKNIKFVITRDDGYTANNAVNSLVQNLLISIVIIAILLIFSLGFKEAMIVSVLVPMILSLTLFIGFMMDETINRITLFALIVSLGMLVDAAIIVIENIVRHKKEDTNNYDLKTISINATNEIGNATNIATIAIIMTFIPMFFVGGMMGQFMHPLPVFVPIALVVSLFVAYVFTPYLVKKFL